MKKITVDAWAVVMFDGFLPDFSVPDRAMEDVYQVHSSKESAIAFCKSIGNGWGVVSCKISYEI